ncbi:MAG: ZIP family metal transporter [Gammaproteobacteria bacterium]|nr:ZIP family metal transporter [Gammaproteobacteria bacterium]MCW8841509.1 ZIP family metal transporter [Gammaproteobacteria bacterium]MCW8958025.1 ZIP family metal transporter [Gammaproteobacteria bacterium]MCW8974053.1 ZIP family metal transporter [Gammaproteobacteria bacterium]MCW8993891.1 ZIP family metal transporter [Gammaproteobacteria bacterium]
MPPVPFEPEASQIAVAFLASLLAGMATGLGSLAILTVQKLSRTLEDSLLSIAAGIMLAASIFSLLLPGLEHATRRFDSEVAAVVVVTAGVMLGAVLLWSLDRWVPHEHLHMGREGPEGVRIKRIWLFVFAITLHNLPEGTAVGVAMMQQDLAAGMSLAVGIGLQNIPEGLAVSVALLSVGYSRRMALGVGVASGLVEPVGGLFGALLVWLAAPLLPLFLGLAAGAMLYVITDEIIPETHRRADSSHITFSLLGGFVVMMFLDVLLG